MSNTEKLTIKKNRLATLQNNPKNIKCQGCVRKLKRQILKMEASM